MVTTCCCSSSSSCCTTGGRATGAPASSGSAYRDPGYTELALAALPWWRTLEDEADLALLDQCGQIDHGARRRAGRHRAGPRGPRLPVRAACRRPRPRPVGPGCAPRSVSCCRPTAASCRPTRSVDALLDAGGGARGRDPRPEPVLSIERLGVDGADGVRVATDAGHRTPAVVVVAAGAWVAGLLEGGPARSRPRRCRRWPSPSPSRRTSRRGSGDPRGLGTVAERRAPPSPRPGRSTSAPTRSGARRGHEGRPRGRGAVPSIPITARTSRRRTPSPRWSATSSRGSPGSTRRRSTRTCACSPARPTSTSSSTGSARSSWCRRARATASSSCRPSAAWPPTSPPTPRPGATAGAPATGVAARRQVRPDAPPAVRPGAR